MNETDKPDMLRGDTISDEDMKIKQKEVEKELYDKFNNDPIYRKKIIGQAIFSLNKKLSSENKKRKARKKRKQNKKR